MAAPASRKLKTSLRARGPQQRIPAKSAVAAPSGGPSTFAVFVAHGMGQQIPFETLDAVVEQLRTLDETTRGTAPPPAEVGTIEIGAQRLQRVELKLKAPNGEREIHLYEGYWAPLTEGQVNLRDVLRFLLGTGWNGIQHGWGAFRRWIFGEYWTFEIPPRSYRHLIAAILIVLALMVMNAAIVGMAAARSPLVAHPAWLTHALETDLESVFDGVLLALLLLGGFLVRARDLRDRGVDSSKRRRLAAFTANFLFWIPFLALVLGGAAIPYFLHRDLRSGVAPWSFFDDFEHGFESGLFVAVSLGALFLLGRMLIKLLRPSEPQPDVVSKRSRVAWPSLAVLLIFVLLGIGWARPEPLFGLGPARVQIALIRLQSALVWGLLVVISAFVRTFLIQYLGDVAAYVTPHTLDRFYELRTKIKETVYQQARAVFALRDSAGNFVYDRVAIVGHSLGSAVVYDVLNRLLEEDELTSALMPAAASLDVLGRTKLLLTFGSPLNKFAFFFALQGQETTDVREALAAEVQPLIRDFGFRAFKWINIYSPWDVISGALTFYDRPVADSLDQCMIDPAKIQAWAARNGMKPATFGEIVPPLSPRELTFEAAGANVTWADFLAAFEVGHLALRYGGGKKYAIVSRYAVENRLDEEATTFFAAHTEYWKHPPALKGAPIVVDILYRHLIA